MAGAGTSVRAPAGREKLSFTCRARAAAVPGRASTAEGSRVCGCRIDQAHLRRVRHGALAPYLLLRVAHTCVPCRSGALPPAGFGYPGEQDHLKGTEVIIIIHGAVPSAGGPAGEQSSFVRFDASPHRQLPRADPSTGAMEWVGAPARHAIDVQMGSARWVGTDTARLNTAHERHGTVCPVSVPGTARPLC
jgi:hypothetical protein